MIWTLPFGMEFWMTGAEITLVVEGDREVLADVARRCSRRTCSCPSSLRTKSTAGPAVLVRADGRRRDLVAAEQRRVLSSGRGPGPRSPGSCRAGRSRAGRSVPTSLRTASGSVTPGSSTTTRSRALGDDDRLGHAGRVHAPLDDVLDDRHVGRGRRLAVDGHGLVLDAEAALQVEPELGLDRPPRAVGARRVGQLEAREEVDDQGEDRR